MSVLEAISVPPGRTLLRRLTLAALAVLLVAGGACKNDDADALPEHGVRVTAEGAEQTSSGVPLAEAPVYTCEMSVVKRGAAPFGQAEAWAEDEATARARAFPRACAKAGGGAACGAEAEGWEVAADCRPSLKADKHGYGHKGWSCVATATQSGVARVEAESPKSMKAACEMAHIAACEVARGGDDCRELRDGWEIVDRVRGKRIRHE